MIQANALGLGDRAQRHSGPELTDDQEPRTAQYAHGGTTMQDLQDDQTKSKDARLTATQVFLRGIGRIVMTAFFSRIEVVNADRFPVRGPVLVVSNHGNSLVDGVLVSCYLPRMPRLLAASILWDYKPLVPLLRAAGVVPVFRQQDVGVKIAKDRPLFDRSSQVLSQGDALSVFPEGLSHNEPHLLPLKSGAARIALEAEAQVPGSDVQILPVGITFDEKNKFRSRVLIQVGEPLNISEQVCAYTSTQDTSTRRAVVRDLTDKIHCSLAQVTLSFSSWDDAELIRQVTDLWAEARQHADAGDDMLDHVELQRAFSEGYSWLKRHCPHEVKTARDDLERYNALLSETGVELEANARRASGWDGLLLLALLPMWLIGSTLNFVPFHVSRWFAHGKDEDKMATWSLFSSLILFPASWLIQAIMLGFALSSAQGFGWGVFWAVMILSPGAGYLALEFLDRRRRWLAALRARWARRHDKDSSLSLGRLRADLLEQIEGLVGMYTSRAEHSLGEPTVLNSTVTEKNP